MHQSLQIDLLFVECDKQRGSLVFFLLCLHEIIREVSDVFVFSASLKKDVPICPVLLTVLYCISHEAILIDGNNLFVVIFTVQIENGKWCTCRQCLAQQLCTCFFNSVAYCFIVCREKMSAFYCS